MVGRSGWWVIGRGSAGDDGAQRWEKVKLAHDSVLELDPFSPTLTFMTQDNFFKSELKLY